MKKLNLRGNTFQRVDIKVSNWMARNGLFLLRMSVGLIFIWFGVLKFFPGASPAESLASRTIEVLTFGVFSEQTILIGLAIWETVIGIGLLFRIFLREVLLLMYIQMLGTLTPIFIFPDEVFHIFPYSLTIEGQYIIKNLVVISAGIVIGATVRGGKLDPEPGK
jgi:uncharacterized membrane protein YkgB